MLKKSNSMMRMTRIFLTLILALLVACSATSHRLKPTNTAASKLSNNTLNSTPNNIVNNTPNNTIRPAQAPSKSPAPITPLSPYSTEGLLALNEFRSANSYLNDFLIQNRKPDYFFSGDNSDYSYKKIYLVYFESENLYLFDPELSEHYKKFHPLPDSIKASFTQILAERSANKAPESPVSNSQPNTQSDIRNVEDLTEIEKSLALNNPAPYLYSKMLYAVPRSGADAKNPLYPDLYFLDKPLSELLENEYSEKYDSKKQILKLIFPKSYDTEILYKKQSIETRKIFVEHSQNNPSSKQGGELSLIVPDFLPGSDFYQTTHSNMTKAFSSLYQVKVSPQIVKNKRLRMRYSIKLCQKDAFDYCAVNKNNAVYVRAIVISATLYDDTTKTPIETFVLK